jgi:hypothetical protein
MRTLWHGLGRIVFWSYERGTLPYDVAVVVIVVFVLFSPRSWFEDRPQPEAVSVFPVAPAMVELRGADPADGAPIYRVDARLISQDVGLEQQLREAVRKHVGQAAPDGAFKVLHVAPVRERDGTIRYYDVCIKP